MLTRLEVSGFKNLVNFEVAFGPFTCLAGPNGVGKSNVFDAIRFLSLLCDKTLIEAALEVRDSDTHSSDLRDLFWTDGRTRAEQFTIAAEMIVRPLVRDDFGRPAEARSTFLRYRISIGRDDTSSDHLPRLKLLSESLTYIPKGSSAQRLGFKHSPSNFVNTVIINKRHAQSGYISTTHGKDNITEINVHSDGGGRGGPQRSPAAGAPRSIVGITNTYSTPTILAARREMQSWRLLALEPSSMRRSDRFHDPRSVSSSGAHLAATVYRLVLSESGASSGSAYSNIAARLTSFVQVEEIGLDIDEVRQLLTLRLREPSGVSLPARSLSDGTLRFLSLCIIAEDPEAVGVVCMEEPENGIHPARMAAMVDLLRDISVDTNQRIDDSNPFRQLLIASHSPHFVQLQRPEDLLVAMKATVVGPDGRPTPTLRCRPIAGTWRCSAEEQGVGMSAILSYLTAPAGAQLKLADRTGVEL